MDKIIQKDKIMTIYDFTVKSIDGKNISMDTYKDKVLLILMVY